MLFNEVIAKLVWRIISWTKIVWSLLNKNYSPDGSNLRLIPNHLMVRSPNPSAFTLIR